MLLSLIASWSPFARVLVLLSCVISIPCHAQKPISFPSGANATVVVDHHMEVLIDPTRKLTLKDVLDPAQGHRFRSSPNGVVMGYTRDAAWVRFAITELPRGEPVILWLTPAFADLIDVYIAEAKPDVLPTDFALTRVGDHRPLPVDGQSGLGYGIPLSNTKGEPLYVYIRVASIDSSLNLSAILYKQTDHTLSVTTIGVVSGFWFGGMTVLLLVQVVFFYYHRKFTHLLLALSTFGAMLVYIGNLGISRVYFFPDGGRGNDIFTASAVWFGMFATCLSTRSILDLPRRAPWLSRLYIFSAFVGLVGLAFALSHRALIFAPWGTTLLALLCALTVGHTVRRANTNGSISRLHAAAYLVLGVGLAVTLAQRSANLYLPNWVAYSYAVSGLLNTLLLTASLAVQLRVAEAANKVISRQALLDAQNSEQRAVLMVEEKTRELAFAKKQAEDALGAELRAQQQQVRFVELMTHQYRTPLAAIRSNVDSIGLSLPPMDLANRDRVDRIRRSITRLVETLEFSRTRSRVQGAALRPNLTNLRLKALVDATVLKAQELYKHRSIRVEMAENVEEVWVRGDSEMLMIAILNLIENAVKFSSMKSDTPIELSCQTINGEIVVAVKDHGIGIPSADLSNVLEKTVRASNATNIDGSGMGLSLVARIAECHNGRVAVESQIDCGTIVRVILPIHA